MPTDMADPFDVNGTLNKAKGIDREKVSKKLLTFAVCNSTNARSKLWKILLIGRLYLI